jgi:hypothetical protein
MGLVIYFTFAIPGGVPNIIFKEEDDLHIYQVILPLIDALLLMVGK